LVITKFGKPVGRLVPMPPQAKMRGALKGSVLFEGDIVSPLENEWKAAQ
jgi:antitoxin (DNA-binding transcriptional repressor) of toxin-antitoxin stability system